MRTEPSHNISRVLPWFAKEYIYVPPLLRLLKKIYERRFIMQMLDQSIFIQGIVMGQVRSYLWCCYWTRQILVWVAVKINLGQTDHYFQSIQSTLNIQACPISTADHLWCRDIGNATCLKYKITHFTFYMLIRYINTDKRLHKDS